MKKLLQSLSVCNNVMLSLAVVEEGAAENGDITVIDFEGYVDGVAFRRRQSETLFA